MMTQLKNAKFYLQAKLGQRGAEMVEYALVLACVCAVGAVCYAVGTGTGDAGSTSFNTLGDAVKNLWARIGGSIGSATKSST